MIKRVSIFKIAILLTIIGIGWMSYQFSLSEKESENFLLSIDETIQIETNLDRDLGFYKISLPNLGDSVFVQIMDPFGRIISDKKIETKSSVNYFEPGYEGRYIMKITNLTDHPLKVSAEFGDTNSSSLIYPGILTFSGIVLIIVLLFRKLYHYKIAQPDEKTS